jgi:hypothetical protein
MADILPEKWMKVMAVTTTVLGVIASVALSRSSYFITKSQFLTAQEEDQWAYYQAKSIKEDLYLIQETSLQADLLGETTPLQSNLMKLTIQGNARDIVHYDQEKADIKKKAEDVHKQNALGVATGTKFSLAVVFAQIGIMLSSVGFLLKRRTLWFVGLVLGSISIFFIVDGFLFIYRISHSFFIH